MTTSDSLLDAARTTDNVQLDRLQAGLISRADGEGLLDIAYRTVESPVGSLLLAATELGLLRVAYAIEDHDVVLSHIAATVSPRVLQAPQRLEDTARELDEYFAGRRQGFDLPLDLRLSGGFRREILGRLPRIGYGQTVSYAAMAATAGRPKASRAVGTACATNPVPIVIPCHRVVRSDGTLGGYLGGLEIKRQLLDLEAAV
jgi:methylated-DNA-[protein]-cysteine S-methyltransferase